MTRTGVEQKMRSGSVFLAEMRDLRQSRCDGAPRCPGNTFCRPHFVGLPSPDAISLSTTRWRHGEKKTGRPGSSRTSAALQGLIILSSGSWNPVLHLFCLVCVLFFFMFSCCSCILSPSQTSLKTSVWEFFIAKMLSSALPSMCPPAWVLGCVLCSVFYAENKLDFMAQCVSRLTYSQCLRLPVRRKPPDWTPTHVLTAVSVY